MIKIVWLFLSKFQTMSRFWFRVTSTNPCNYDETMIVCSLNDSKNFLYSSINILMSREHSTWLLKTRSYLLKSPLLNILQCLINTEQSLSLSLLFGLVLHHQLHHLLHSVQHPGLFFSHYLTSLWIAVTKHHNHRNLW